MPNCGGRDRCCLWGCSFRVFVLTNTEQLYVRTKPGSPYYMPDTARQVARVTLDHVFPTGAYTRALVAMLFRLLQPGMSTYALIASLFSHTHSLFLSLVFFRVHVALHSLLDSLRHSLHLRIVCCILFVVYLRVLSAQKQGRMSEL